MIATIRALTGTHAAALLRRHADPARAAVRDLKEEALRVFRTRVVNPKWIDSITRHGYKGALELAATVDYLFGYDATAHVVDDWMYEQVTRTLRRSTRRCRRSSRAATRGRSRTSVRACWKRCERGLWAAARRPKRGALWSRRTWTPETRARSARRGGARRA